MDLTVTNNLWFEVALVAILFTIGNILFGHFEVHTPKWKRIMKFIFFTVAVCALSYHFGRGVGLSFLGLIFLPVIYIHAVWLPKKGINGWTAEPKEKYYKLRGWDNKL